MSCHTFTCGLPTCLKCDAARRIPAIAESLGRVADLAPAKKTIPPRNTRAALPTYPCVHRGDRTGERTECGTCGGGVMLPVQACAVHGRCVVAKTPNDSGIECCATCKSREEPAPAPARTATTITIEHGASGIGDGLLALLPLRALKRSEPHRRITLRVSPYSKPFVVLFADCYDTLQNAAYLHYEQYVPGAVQMNIGYTAENESKYQRPRWERYRANIGSPGIEIPELRDRAACISAADPAHRGRVVLAPFSTATAREWPLPHWLTLERLLIERGYETAVLHDKRHRTERFGGLRLIDLPPQTLAGVMLAAKCIVGGDSGMAHLGGILGAPTVVLGGSTPVERIFGAYPSASFIQGGLDCSGCGERGGVVAECNRRCDNLASITPERVAAEVDRRWLTAFVGDRSLLDHRRLATLRDEAIRTRPLSGAIAEVGVYRGGVAKLLSEYAPNTPLHLFDTFTGIPEDDADGEHKAGDFPSDAAEVEQYLGNPNAVFHVGVFPETAWDIPANVRYKLVHLDGDTYQTTLAGCEYFGPRMVPGGAIVFDDYGWRMTPGVQRALHETFGDRAERTAEYQAVVRF